MINFARERGLTVEEAFRDQLLLAAWIRAINDYKILIRLGRSATKLYGSRRQIHNFMRLFGYERILFEIERRMQDDSADQRVLGS